MKAIRIGMGMVGLGALFGAMGCSNRESPVPSAPASAAPTAAVSTDAAAPTSAAAASAASPATPTAGSSYDPTAEVVAAIGQMQVKPGDWPQWGGSAKRNNTPAGKDIPTSWDVDSGENIVWSAQVGSQTYGNPVVANGKVLVGTNNGAGYIERYPAKVDLGCLLCFDDASGDFLWQHSSEKLPTGRVHDWPLQGICCSPLVDGERLWYVTSRGEVVCLDLEGFHDGQNDGPFTQEPNEDKNEADIIWRLDMMKDLGVSQHNMCSCSLTADGDRLYVLTANGVDEGHINIPAPDAPSFIVVNKDTGKVIWTDKSPGTNILHGQWSSPAVATLGGVKQVLFPGGDGWLYSFRADADEPELLWKFDANPKESTYSLGGKATRNHLIGTPVIHDGLVYIGVGEDPEHGEGIGHFYCIDPTKRGDVSPELVFNKENSDKPIPPKRIQACEPKLGDFTRPNPNSAQVWHYSREDADGDGKVEFEEEMHRTIGTAAVKDGLCYIADFSGLFHCLDAKTGKRKWFHDMLAASWSSAVIVDGKVFIGDEDGDVAIFEHGPELKLIGEINMGNSVYTTPVVANDALYIANRSHVFKIKQSKQ